MARNPGTQEDAQNVGGELHTPVPLHEFTNDDYAGIASFDDAMRLAVETLGADAIATADAELGDGFAVVTNKDQLIGVGFIILAWTFSDGDMGSYVVARCVTRDHRKIVLVDGGHGIYQQLRDYTAKKERTSGLMCRMGLRRSDYKTEIPDPKTGELVMTPASTYYIDTAAAPSTA